MSIFIDVQSHQRHRYNDPRQVYNNDSSLSQSNNIRNKKDQKLSAESGGTDFNSQNPSNTNQTEEFRREFNIGQRSQSPENDQMSIPSLMIQNPQIFEEDVLLGENEVLTPRRQEQLENESKKTSGASTPSRDGADTPTRKNFNEHQQQFGDKKGFIHDLTSSNPTRKYPIDRRDNQEYEGNSYDMPNDNI